MNDAAAVEVLIPHWNRASSLARTLDALGAQTSPPRVCVIDNGSTDGSAAMLAAEHPEARVVRLDRNLGFGAAVNRGVATSAATLVVLVNNDVVPDSRFVERIVAAQRSTGAEMVAACLRSPGGAVESVGVAADRGLNPYDAAFGEPFGPALRRFAPLGPSGGAGAYLRQALIAVGGFDEMLFAYLEDLDLAIRMRLAGMRCELAADAFAWHEHSATLGARSSRKNELLGFARGYLIWKYGLSIDHTARLGAAITDLVVYAGKAVIDRNLGAPRGRLRARAAVRGRPRPPADPRVAELPLLPLTTRQGLRRRLARRR